jgi:hypothetical protein
MILPADSTFGGLNMDEMYCYVGDLLGFRDMILNLEEEMQEERVEEWIQFVEVARSKYRNITHSHLVSDTIFIGAEANQNGLGELLHFSKNLLEDGVSKGFLLRGSITFGKVKWDDRITFGKIQNTRIFSMYLEKIKDFAASIKTGIVHPSQPYAGLLPTYFIEQDWKKILSTAGFLKEDQSR